MKLKFLLFILFPAINIFPQFDSDTLNRYLSGDSLKIDSVSADTAGLPGDSLKISGRDSLSFMTQSPLYPGSYFIPNRKLMFMDYRYAGDFLEAFPFTFILDKGFIGQRNEVFVYGAGFGSVSYFRDGVLINDRPSNSLDLNHIQSESVDSIEIIPSPRGFLYGPVNNPVSVNLITKDFIPRVPYSRIKYYEGPFGEAMFDGIFSAMFFRKLNFFADITNRKTDDSFDNSSFSIWQAGARLKYLFSESLNISGSYNFVHSETGLNGGINADSISRITADIDSLLYSETEAPVVYPDGLQKNKQHHFNLRTLFNPFKNLKSDLNLYYKFYLDEVENIDEPWNIISGNSNVKSKILGASLKETYSTGILNTQINFNYEHHDFFYKDGILSVPELYTTGTTRNYEIFSLSPIVSLIPRDSSLIFSVFYKYKKSFLTEHGAGLDLFYRINSVYQFYVGYSMFELYPSYDIETIEAGVRYSENNILFDLRFYNRDPNGLYPWFGSRNSSISGVGINSEILFWKIQLESYLNIPADKNYYNQFQIRGGIFYKDILFDSSLALKTGFNFLQFERHELVTRYRTKTGNSKPRIDFTLAGEIQKSAIIYFAWENLLNEEYYIVPFYPMPERNIRFGIAWEILN